MKRSSEATGKKEEACHSGMTALRRSERILIVAILCTISLIAVVSAEKRRLGDLPEESGRNKQFPPSPDDPASPEDKKRKVSDVTEDFYRQGLKALKEGRLEEAEGFFDRVLILKPDHGGARRGINEIMKNMEPSRPPAKEKDPKTAALEKYRRDMARSFTGENWDETARIAAKILALNPNDSDAKQKLTVANRSLFSRAVQKGQLRETAGDAQGAVEAYRTALTYRSDPALREKIKTLQNKITKQSHQKSDELYLEALTASQRGEQNKALSLCRRALELNPNNLQAQRMLERLKSHPAS